MFTFQDFQDECKRRALRDQSGTDFDTAIKNALNMSLFRVSREAMWRSMRRTGYFDTVGSYTTGSGNASATTSSVNVVLQGASLLTDNVQTSRYIKLSGSSKIYTLRSITGSTSCTIDMQWSASTTTSMTYEIYPQEEYILPIQASHRMFMFHEDYGYPYQLDYVTEQDFLNRNYDRWEKGTPVRYRMWGEDMARQQPKQAGVLSVFSTVAGDTSISVTIFGIANGYPVFETIATNASNGTTTTTGAVSFSSVERVVKYATSSGRINVCADANTSTVIAVMPIGDTTAGILYRKVKLHPLPTRVFPINVLYYKEPYRLVNAGDIHELGQDFDEAIILLSVAKIKSESSQKEAANFYSLFQDELKTLRKINTDKIDWFPTLERPGNNRRDSSVHPQLKYRQAGSNFGPRSSR